MKNKSFNLVLSIVFFVVGILLFFNPIEQLGYIIRALVLLNLLVALRELIYYIKNSRVFSKMYLINPIVTIIFCILLATQDLFNLGLLIPSFLAFWIFMMSILILNNPTFFARIIAYTVSFLVIEHAVYQYKIYLKYHDIK